MAVVTAEQVVAYTNISATEAQVAASGLIPIVQDRIGVITNNYFASDDICVHATLTFTASARTVVATSLDWEAEGFAAGDEIYIYGSIRNDGYYEVSSVSSGTMTLVTGSSVVAEKSGASIMVSLVQWPRDVQYAAAQMVKFDYDDRKSRTGVTSRSLGPFSESYADGGLAYGYPDDVLQNLTPYRMASML
jgi:hypothetical protein